MSGDWRDLDGRQAVTWFMDPGPVPDLDPARVRLTPEAERKLGAVPPPSFEVAEPEEFPIMARMVKAHLRIQATWELIVVRGLIQEIESGAVEPIFPVEPTLYGKPILGLEPAAVVRERALEAAQRLFLNGGAESMLEALQLLRRVLESGARE